jgi:hypothetical protein
MTHLVAITVIAIAVVLPTITAQSSASKDLPGQSRPSQQPAPCHSPSPPSDNPDNLLLVSSFAPEPAYVDLPIEQIEKIVPLLNPTMPDAIPSEDDPGAASQLTKKTEFILGKTGEAIADLLHRTPNLLANEKVKVIDENLNTGSKYESTTDYFYRIVHRRNQFGSDGLAEFRTYIDDNPVDDSPKNPNRLINIGFATLWLVFLPGNLGDSHFRYLGEQLIEKHETYVIAFAQKPQNTGLRPVINYSSGQCTTPLQGIAWIDQSTFRIVRLQTDLLHSLPDIQLSQLRTVLTYQSVKIGGLHLSLWLPKDVETTYHTSYREVKESHSYSHYRLFKATMKVLTGLR